MFFLYKVKICAEKGEQLIPKNVRIIKQKNLRTILIHKQERFLANFCAIILFICIKVKLTINLRTRPSSGM